MVVITLENCPPALRGDLTKWLQEISHGVYVGQVGARVRDKLWERVCGECKNGRATMVFAARNEQHYDFRVHNASWEPIDYDGIKLMMRPGPVGKSSHDTPRCTSTAFLVRKRRGARQSRPVLEPPEYVVLDIETTGLDPERDEIIEVAALKIINGEEKASYRRVVKPQREVPDSVLELTGLSREAVSGGQPLVGVLEGLLSFIGYCPIVAHNADFDLGFINAATRDLEMEDIENEVVDTLFLSREIFPGAGSYRLERLTDYLGIVNEKPHRAFCDARATRELFLKLIENS